MDWTVDETVVYWVGWGVVILWSLFSTLATVDALPLYFINRETYHEAKIRRNHKLDEIGARGDLRKSRNFMIGFFLSALVGYGAAAGRILAPPDPDNSLFSLILSTVLVVMIYFFWRAKHADRVTVKQQERYTQEHEEGRDAE
jgi:hypothetical protein